MISSHLLSPKIKIGPLTFFVFLVALSVGVVVIVGQEETNWAPWGVLALGVLIMTFVAALSRHPQTVILFTFLVSLPTLVGKQLFLVEVPYPLSGPFFFTLYIYDVFFLILVGLTLLKMPSVKRMGFNLKMIDLLPLGFIIWSLVSLIQAKSLSLGLLQLYLIGKGFVFYLFLARFIRTPEHLNTVFTAISIGVIFQAAIITAQLITGINFQLLGVAVSRPAWVLGTEFLRPGGTPGADVVVGEYLVLVLPICLIGATIGYGKRLRALAGFAFIAGTFGLIATLSRAGLISLVTSIVIILLLSTRSRQIAKSVPIKILLTILLAAGPIAYFLGDIMFHRLVEDAAQSITSRIDFLKIAWEITWQQPLFGIGLGNFVLAAPSYDIRGLLFAYPTEIVVHNLPLLLTSEIGIVGFLFALLFSVGLVVRLTRCISSNNPILAGFSVALLGSLAAMFVSGLFDSVLRNEIVVVHFWVVAGFGMAIARLGAKKIPFPSAADKDHILRVV